MLTASPAPGGILAGPTLQACLRLTVPALIDQVRFLPAAELATMIAESAGELAGGLRGLAAGTGDPAPAISHLARLIAITALGPGGITFCGRHWCTAAHPGCPDLPDDPPPVPLRP